MNPLWILLAVALVCALVAWELHESATEAGQLDDRISNLKLRLWIATRLYRIICWLGKDD